MSAPKTAAKTAQKALSLKEAAALKGVSQDTLRRAIHATEPPFLRAKKVGAHIRIGENDLEDWWDQLPDA